MKVTLNRSGWLKQYDLRSGETASDGKERDISGANVRQLLVSLPGPLDVRSSTRQMPPDRPKVDVLRIMGVRDLPRAIEGFGGD